MGLIKDWLSRFVTGVGLDRTGAGQELPVLSDNVDNHRVSHWNEIAKITIALQKQVFGAPWFEWNATDLSQFDALIDGPDVSASSASVVASAGVNWIQVAVTSNAAVNPARNLTVLPITQAPPTADYVAIVEYISVVQLSNIPGPAIFARFASHTSGYFVRHANVTTSSQQAEKLIAGPAITPLGSGQGDPNNFGAGVGIRLGIGVEATTIVRVIAGEEQIIEDTSSPITAAGQAGIGCTPGTIVGSVTNRFRNIRCYTVI